MNSAELIFNILQSKLPPEVQKECLLYIHGWDRKKIQRIAKYMAIQNIIGMAPANLSAKEAAAFVYKQKAQEAFPEAGLALEFTSQVKADNKNVYVQNCMCIPCLDTSSKELSKNTYEGIKLWQAFEKFYKNKKVYIFESGNAKHMIVDHLCEKGQFQKFLKHLVDNDVRKADLRWVKHSLNGSAVLRVTSGQENRPEPYLDNWYII